MENNKPPEEQKADAILQPEVEQQQVQEGLPQQGQYPSYGQYQQQQQGYPQFGQHPPQGYPQQGQYPAQGYPPQGQYPNYGQSYPHQSGYQQPMYGPVPAHNVSAGGQLAFGIVMICLASLLGLGFAIAGVVNAAQVKKQPTHELAMQKLKTARTFNFVALGINIAGLVVMIVLFSVFWNYIFFGSVW